MAARSAENELRFDPARRHQSKHTEDTMAPKGRRAEPAALSDDQIEQLHLALQSSRCTADLHASSLAKRCTPKANASAVAKWLRDDYRARNEAKRVGLLAGEDSQQRRIDPTEDARATTAARIRRDRLLEEARVALTEHVVRHCLRGDLSPLDVQRLASARDILAKLDSGEDEDVESKMSRMLSMWGEPRPQQDTAAGDGA